MRKRRTSTPHDVYRVFDADHNLLYVGCSINAFRRIRQHKAEHQPWFPAAVTVDIDQYPDKDTARLVEATSIATEAPAWNVAREATALVRGRHITPEAIDHFDGVPISMFWRVA